MLRRSLLLPVLAPALLLGGCLGTENRGLESVHQPVVSRQDYALDLQTAGDGLARGEGGRLQEWLDAMHLRYGDKVAIDDPTGYPGTRADVARVVASHGLLVSDDHPVTPAPVAPGIVRVVISRVKASVPACPDWSRDSSHEYDSNTSSNYGCATNANLAAMIANPEDLVHGQRTDELDTVRSTKAIETFRKSSAAGGK